jgi:hypothetical protein
MVVRSSWIDASSPSVTLKIPAAVVFNARSMHEARFSTCVIDTLFEPSPGTASRPKRDASVTRGKRVVSPGPYTMCGRRITDDLFEADTTASAAALLLP